MTDDERLREIANHLYEDSATALDIQAALLAYGAAEYRRGMERAAHICDVTSEHNLDKAAANVGHVAEIFTRQAALAKAIANAIRAAMTSEEK